MDNEELLAQLADIHLPVAVSFWPPAPGWWLLALLVISTIAWWARKLYLSARRRKICRYALAELEHSFDKLANVQAQDSDAKLLFINQCNAVMRRVALWHFPESKAASLAGDDWVAFIREKGDSSKLDQSLATALSQGRFQSHCDIDVNALNTMARQWIESLYSRADKGTASA